MARTIEFKTAKDNRGSLSVIEKILPFEIKRVYYIYGCSGETRGGHRHKKTIQLLTCVAGSCEIFWDNGTDAGTVTLDDPSVGLLVLPEDWHTMSKFSPDAVLLVLASEHYDAEDYVDEGYNR